MNGIAFFRTGGGKDWNGMKSIEMLVQRVLDAIYVLLSRKQIRFTPAMSLDDYHFTE